MAASLLLLGAAALAVASSSDTFLFHEDFQGSADPLGAGGRWVKSTKAKYGDQPIAVTQATIPGFEHEKTLILPDPMWHYGVAAAFNQPVANGEGEEFVLQYEVKMEEPLTCGGAYIKLFDASVAGVAEGEFDNDTPYIIMFGPDRCGATNKVHFILRHRNPVTGEWEEKHAQDVPQVKVDKKSHVYTLVIRPDNSFEILIDGKSEKSGSLLTDMSPPVNPPAEIDDPEDTKPADWVDEAKIPDPAARKPEDWDEDAPAQIPDMEATKPEGWLDDEPEMVPDPEAAVPDDWDEEEDGAWEAPMVYNPKCQEGPGCGEWVRPMKSNPAYKGKWSAPMIDNPEYKGEWAPKRIANPAFFTDETPYILPPMSALAVEVWTTNRGLRMDSFVVGHDASAALAYAQTTWKPKFDAELKAEEAATQANKAEDRAKRVAEAKEKDGWKGIAKLYLTEATAAAKQKPLAAGATLAALLLSLVFLFGSLRGSGSEEEAAEAAAAPAAAKAVENENEEEEEEEEEEEDDDEEDEDEGKPRRRSARKKAD